jgi:hypothetical protein
MESNGPSNTVGTQRWPLASTVRPEHVASVDAPGDTLPIDAATAAKVAEDSENLSVTRLTPGTNHWPLLLPMAELKSDNVL